MIRNPVGIHGNSLADFRSGRIAEKQDLGFRGGAGLKFAQQVEDEVGKRYTVLNKADGSLTTIYWDAATSSPAIIECDFSAIPASDPPFGLAQWLIQGPSEESTFPAALRHEIPLSYRKGDDAEGMNAGNANVPVGLGVKGR